MIMMIIIIIKRTTHQLPELVAGKWAQKWVNERMPTAGDEIWIRRRRRRGVTWWWVQFPCYYCHLHPSGHYEPLTSCQWYTSLHVVCAVYHQITISPYHHITISLYCENLSNARDDIIINTYGSFLCCSVYPVLQWWWHHCHIYMIYTITRSTTRSTVEATTTKIVCADRPPTTYHIIADSLLCIM